MPSDSFPSSRARLGPATARPVARTPRPVSHPVSSAIPGSTEAAPSSQRVTQPISRPPDATITTANGVSVPTASPLSSSAAPARGNHWCQRDSRDKSVPTTNATNAVSTTNIDGLLPCSTARSTVAFSTRQMTVAITAAAAPASPAATALSASRH